MQPIAADVARSVDCVSVCWLHGRAVQERLNRSRWRLGDDSYKLDGDQDRTNPFAAATGNKLAMRPFARLLWTLVEPVFSSRKWSFTFTLTLTMQQTTGKTGGFHHYIYLTLYRTKYHSRSAVCVCVCLSV